MVVLGATEVVPLVATFPTPLIVQEVAFAELHVRVEDEPRVIVVGFADNDPVTAGAVTVTVALAGDEVPPAPVHVTE